MGIKNGKLRNFMLAFFVVLSFLLSYNLWTAGRNIGEETTSGQATLPNVSLTSHSESDAFRPTTVALHGVDAEAPLQIGRTYPLNDVLDEAYETRTLDRIESSEMMTYEGYIDQLENGRWLEFVFNEESPLGLIEQKFDDLPRDQANNYYDRIAINIDGNSVYFYHTDSGSLYIASTLEDASMEVDPFLNEESIQYVEAFPTVLDNNIVYLPENSVAVPYQSYVIGQLPNSVYINNFFPDASLVDTRSTNNIYRYIDLTKEVTIDQNNNTLEYLRQIEDAGELEPTTRFERSFEQINRFENWSDTFVLSSYNRESEIISFQREIDGYPVFSPLGQETVSEIGLVESGVTHMELPLRFISTPISMESEGYPTKEMITGRELVDTLVSRMGEANYETIEDISLGYSWEESAEDSQVVNFTPNWYLLIEGDWVTYDEFLEEGADGL